MCAYPIKNKNKNNTPKALFNENSNNLMLKYARTTTGLK